MKRAFAILAALAVATLAGAAGWQLLAGPEAIANAEPSAPLPPTMWAIETRREAGSRAPSARATEVAEPGRLGQGPEHEQCLGLLRENPDAARGFALAWEARGGGDGARHCAALALLASGDPARAADRLEALGVGSSLGAADRAVILGQAVQAWTLAGDANRAYGAATLALTLSPNDPDLLLDRAIALAGQGRHAEALDDLDRAVAVAPDRAEAWVMRATALRRTDHAAAAERAIERALTLEAENAEALLERGILRLERGDRNGANADWQRAIAVAPDSAAADLAAQNLALNEAGPQRR